MFIISAKYILIYDFFSNWHVPDLPCTFQGVVGFHHPGAISVCACAPSQHPGRRLKNGPVCGQAHKGPSGPPFFIWSVCGCL